MPRKKKGEKRMKRYFFLILIISFILTSLFKISAYSSGKEAKACGASTPIEKVKSVISLQAYPFNLTQVKLLGGPFQEAMERDKSYMLSLDPDRLLHNFRLNAGLPSTAEPLGGWEKPDVELRGHTVGHYLTACALMYASTGDEKLKGKADYIVSELAKCQNALGPSGYLSAYPEEFMDRVETGKRVWAPWYTLHKIYAGLLDMYIYFGNNQALEIAKKMADWAKKRTDLLSDDKMQFMLRVEHGGMNEVLRNLYAVTGNRDYFDLARRFDHKAVLDPLADHRDKLKGLHVNTQIPKIIGAARAYELTGDKYYYNVATYFWKEVTEARSYVTGGTSNNEGWESDPYQLSTFIGPNSHETCCTYNMLKLTRHLFTWNPDPSFADYYERALINGILSTQNPGDGMMMYYVPMASGLYKTFMKPLDSFWCCTGTGMENHAKYGDSIYFHDNEGIFVNLFIASELFWPEKGIRLRQETRFPEQEGTTLLIKASKPVELTFRIRIPSWVGPNGGVKVNGQRVNVFSNPASYLAIKRTWKDGDRIEVDLPMYLHLHRMPDNPNMAAIMYGPIVLAGELGAEGLTEEKVYGRYGPGFDSVPVPHFLVKSEDLNSWLKPAPDKPLTFTTSNIGIEKDITLVPFYKLFGQRYAIYWNIYTESEWSALKAIVKTLPEGIVDSIKIGDTASEEEHNFRGMFTKSGQESGRNWISSANLFRYDLRILPGEKLTLLCTFLDEDKDQIFDIMIDGRKLERQTIVPKKPGEFFEVEYPIPLEYSLGKKRVAVMFRAEKGKTTGRLFGLGIAIR